MSAYAGARALVFTPLREEYGFVTLEAFRSNKPVITANDSGGPTEIIRDSESGFIVNPKPEAVAEKLDILSKNKELAVKLGKFGNESTAHINWENTVNKLMSA